MFPVELLCALVRVSRATLSTKQADWTMPIDYQNELGVTLLHVAAQNGNKRIAKLCLRKGADVNKRNNNGQVRTLKKVNC